MLDSVIRVNKKYCLQTLLEECKYETKEDKIENLTDDDFVKSSSDSESNESDNRSDNGSDNDEFNDESEN